MAQPINFMTKESQYLFIKQKLDSYHISTSFPLEVMPLLHTLINHFEKHPPKITSANYAPFQTNPKPHFFDPSHLPSIEPALRKELTRTLASNNSLHMQLITQKQQIQSLKHCIDKMAFEQADSSKKDEVRQVIRMCREKQKQLVEELQIVKFKYNELVDFVMGQDELQKMYIKKLLNHKKYEDAGQKGNKQVEEPQEKGKNANNRSTQELNSRITFKAGSSRKQSRQRINKTIDSKQNNHRQDFQSEKTNSRIHSKQAFDYKLYQLQHKLANREKQIQRLQALIRHEGPNINKVMMQFNYELQQQHYQKLEERINLLETQNFELKQTLQKYKLNGGRYQALIEEVDKSHALIGELKKENALVKRSQKEKEFDLLKEKKQMNKSVVKAETLKNQLKEQKITDEALISDLKRKVEFYQRELGLRFNDQNRKKDDISNGVKKISKKGVKGNKSQKIKSKESQQLLVKEKSSKPPLGKPVEHRQKYEDQINFSSTKKQEELKPKQKVPKKQVKKLPISQIIEEEQEDESYIKPDQQKIKIGDSLKGQNQNEKPQDNQNQVENENQENSNKNQRAESDSQDSQEVQERNETLIQQYEETINELSSRCLQLKEELASKNQTIKGLEEIANRLINTKENPLGQSDNAESQSIHHLTHQVQTLSSLLNQSEFQKEELRRELIRAENVNKEMRGTGKHENEESTNFEHQISQLRQLLEQKDSKISDMREDNTTIQDQLLKALDRIRRLNDQIDAIKKENEAIKQEHQVKKGQTLEGTVQYNTLKAENQKLAHELSLNQSRLEQAAILLKQQRQRHGHTLQLSEAQKEEIISLRKKLIIAQTKIEQMQIQLDALRQQNQRLIHQLK